jgi:hypothetical protein
MSELITVPLAHKIPAAEALRLGASEHRDYQPGENITVPTASAQMLAAAGQLQVNPRDHEAVADLLKGTPAAPAVTTATAPQAPVTPVPAASAPTGTPTGTPTAASAAASTGTPAAGIAPQAPKP